MNTTASAPETSATRFLGSPRRRALLALAVIAGIAAAMALAFRDTGPCDDDFIVQRYAQNLVEGRGLVFDAGERVEGFTCPLWVGVLAGVLVLGGSAAVAGPWIGFAALLGSAWLALQRAGARGWPAALAAAGAIATSAALAYHAAQGLGTVLAAALVLAWFVTTERAERRGIGGTGGTGFVLPATLLGLATLLRPETAGFALPFLWAVPRGRRLAAALAFAAWSGGWLVFRVAYYGEWLPMTYPVRKLAPLDDLRYGAEYLGLATLECGIGLLLLVCAVARLRGSALLERSSTAALCGAWVTTAMVVWVGGDYLPLARFLVPVLPLALVLGADVLATWVPAHPRPAWAALGALALFGAWPCVDRIELEGRHRFYEERWVAIGKELGASQPPGTRVAASPVGAIGFYSRLPIVDMLGKTNRAIRAAPPDLSITMKGHHRYDAEWVLDQAPDLVILGNGELLPGERTLRVSAWERSLVQHPRFAVEYESLILPVRDSYDLPCFRRRAGTVEHPQPATGHR